MPPRVPHIVVFFGGANDSHDLSQETGYWICNYIPRSKYRITPVRITPEGLWQVPLGGLPQQGPVDRMMNMLFVSLRPVSATQGLERLLRQPVDTMMTTIRGQGGDDGTLPSLGRTLSIPVVGSDTATSQQTFNKHVCADRVTDIVSTPLSFYFPRQQMDETIMDDIRAHLMPPLFVKPASEEGSVGVEEVASLDELLPAVRRAKSRGDVLIQQRVPGTELSVTVVEDRDGRARVLPPTIIVPQRAGFYDHLAKRRPGRVALHTPTDDKNKVLWEAEAIAHDVYEQLRCRGYASLDFIQGPGGLELLDVNTVPTLTSLTPLKQQLHAANLHPAAMLDSLIDRTLTEGT